MNQKGMVLSGLVYALLVFFLLLLVSLLMVMWYRQNAIVSLGKDARGLYEDIDNTIINGPYYNFTEGVNQPFLAPGMTAVKWNGSSWIATTLDDPDWYSYTGADKKWANARTEDGSMWVWIPRYIYRITNGWHTNTAGAIEVQFSITTDDTVGGTVALTNTGSATDSNGTWTSHPAFTFGSVELTGIWVAKFEASGTIDNIDIKPNATALDLHDNVGNVFDAVRNMENNDRYGWGATGLNFDTHLIKNVEWGAAAYLGHSTYGKNVEVWVNNGDRTGCAGDNASDVPYAGCEYTYDTANGQQASTTGNIYGIYDMSGGKYELTSAYINNGNANLALLGSSIINAEVRYKDMYTVTTDDGITNYSNAINKKGDAMYETSSANGVNSWFQGYSFMPTTTTPWFYFGGANVSNNTPAGTFSFGNNNGSVTAFRPIIAVKAGL